MPSLASAPKSLPPAGIVSSFSPLTLMVMSPSLTSLDLANRIISAKTKTMTVNITIPKIISIPIPFL
ncbi:Uncharacterised protein [Neisseria meningitidis]|nr:Uncharacterised protein [Neisseria meningitidis]